MCFPCQKPQAMRSSGVPHPFKRFYMEKTELHWQQEKSTEHTHFKAEKLTDHFRCTLALALALAVLQLHDTPWLKKDWHIKDVYITKNSRGTLLVDRPYVSRTFGSTSGKSSATRRRGVKNDVVFSLGVALLELSWGESIMNLKTQDDLNDQGAEDSMLEFCIATRLADYIHLRELSNYAKAVVRCIRCNFDAFTCEFEDKDFRDGFYEGVVLPLREDYSYATQG